MLTAHIPAELLQPPCGGVPPPVETLERLAPFRRLDPLDFERLCVTLARREADVEHVQRYGDPGQRQHGIDIYARTREGTYRAYQSKRYEHFGPADIVGAVDSFLSGAWVTRSSAFILCTSASSVRTERAEVIEAQAKRLRSREIGFEVWDAEALSDRLKELPIVVLDFFGRAWVDRFCTVPLPGSAQNRLDVDQLARLRERLERFYLNLFARHRGLLPAEGNASVTVGLDVLRRRHLPRNESRDRPAPYSTVTAGSAEGRDAPDLVTNERVDWLRWLSPSRAVLMLGGAGSGKSTLLRFLCLDLLTAEPKAERLGADWRDGLPIWLPFGPWAARASTTDADSSLRSAVRGFFASYDEPGLADMASQALDDERLVLLIDGLDEWVDEGGARRAADRLQQVIAMRDIRAVLCGRPEAISMLGAMDPAWARGQLAPLTDDQAHAVLRSHGAPAEEASALLAELLRRPALTAFARTPLLLALAWRSYGSGETIPSTRVSALGGLVDDIIHEHPTRREAAGGPPARPVPLERLDVQIAVEELALTAAKWGPLPLPVDAARDCMTRTIREHGFSEAEAAPAGRALLEIAQGSMGLLVADQPGVVFAHRALQEYLAGSAIARRPPQERRSILDQRATEPAWRATVLVALSLMEDQGEVASALEALRGVSGRRAQWTTASLLADAAVTIPNCPEALRAELIEYSAAAIELGVGHPEEERIIDALMEGLGVPPAGPAVARRVSGWLPNRIGRSGGLWTSLLQWDGDEPRVEEALWRALRNDDGRVAREAAEALLARPPAWLGSRLEERLAGLTGRQERTVALHTLGRLDPHRSTVARWIDRAGQSDHTALRAVAIDFRVAQGAQTEADLDVALRLADGWTHVAFEWDDLVGQALRAGWPNHARIRQLALETVGPGKRPLDITTASWLLLSGYYGDPDVTRWICSELAGDHPFVTVDGWVAYRLLADHARHSDVVREAIDKRIAEIHTAFMPALAAAALATKSEIAKRRLLRELRDEDSGALGWVVSALQEGWPEDDDARSALHHLAKRPQAAWVASYLVDIVPDDEVDEWLLEVLAAPTNRRPSSAAVALAKRSTAVREEAFEVAMGREKANPATDEDLRDVLIGEYADLPQGAALALDGLTRPDVRLQVLARAARLQPSLRQPVLGMLWSVSKSLRARTAQRLYDGAGGDDAARDLVNPWAFETSPSVAAVSGAALARRSPVEERSSLLEEAVRALHAPPRYPTGRPHGGLAILTELGELNRFAEQRLSFDQSRPLNVEVANHLEPNLWLAAQLAAHWPDIQGALPDPASRLSWMDEHGFWECIAPFASAHPACREACLETVRASGTQGRPNLLRFLAAARPRSRELLVELVSAVDDSVIDRSPRRDSLLLASDLLAEHFGSSSEEPPDELLERLSPDRPPTPGLLLALALGWPRGATFDRALAAFNARPYPMPVDIEWRVHVAVGSAQVAFDLLRRYIEYAAGQTPYLPPLPASLHRRIARDKSFRGLLECALADPLPPSELATFSRLLAGAGQLAGPIRDGVEARCDAALDGDDVDLLAYDLIAGEVRPLGIALLEALEGEAA